MNNLKVLIDAYIELNRLNAEPGSKCHMLASCIQFIQRKIIEFVFGASILIVFSFLITIGFICINFGKVK